jgi:2-iminobutanoate/2-iminopropanoate deaminase
MPFNPASAPLSGHRLAANMAFLSGQVGHEGGIPLPTFESQTHAAIRAIGRELEAAGATYADVVRTTIYLTNKSDFTKMNEIYCEYFDAPFPARTTVVTELAADGFLFEIDAIASIGRPQSTQ